MKRKRKKTGGRQKGVTNKITRDVREAFRKLLENNTDKLEKWLRRVGTKDPARALDLVVKFAEFHMPKLARTELTGQGGGPLQVHIKRKTDAPPPPKP